MDKKYKYIDLNYLNNISNNIDFQKKIFSMFKTEISLIKIDMLDALEKKNYSKLAEIVHKVKSNVSVLGMNDQTEDMKNLETEIKESINVETYKERILKFLFECEEALIEIDDIEKKI